MHRNTIVLSILICYKSINIILLLFIAQMRFCFLYENSFVLFIWIWKPNNRILMKWKIKILNILSHNNYNRQKSFYTHKLWKKSLLLFPAELNDAMQDQPLSDIPKINSTLHRLNRMKRMKKGCIGWGLEQSVAKTLMLVYSRILFTIQGYV